MSDIMVELEIGTGRAVYRLGGSFDRPSAWALRERVERETTAEVLLDFSLVREFSDLAVAVLAHGLTTAPSRVRLRGLRQHQLRIFRYCGVAVEEVSGGSASASVTDPAAGTRLVSGSP